MITVHRLEYLQLTILFGYSVLIPRQGKLGSKWQGGWKVQGVKSEVTIQIRNEKGHSKVVYTCESVTTPHPTI